MVFRAESSLGPTIAAHVVACYKVAAMIHVFRLGPIEFANGDRAFTYAGITDDGELVAPESAHDDATALTKIAARLVSMRPPVAAST